MILGNVVLKQFEENLDSKNNRNDKDEKRKKKEKKSFNLFNRKSKEKEVEVDEKQENIEENVPLENQIRIDSNENIDSNSTSTRKENKSKIRKAKKENKKKIKKLQKEVNEGIDMDTQPRETKKNAFINMKNSIAKKINEQKEKFESRRKERLEEETAEEEKKRILDKIKEENKQKQKEEMIMDATPLKEEYDEKNTDDKKDILKKKTERPKIRSTVQFRRNSRNSKKENDKFEFNPEEYTNKFIKNIIGIDEDELKENENPVRILNVDSINSDNELVMNVDRYQDDYGYENSQDNNYKNINQRRNYRNQSKKKDQKDTRNLGNAVKNTFSAVTLKVSEFTEKQKRKQERRNRIKKNKIYSTSYNRRNRRR